VSVDYAKELGDGGLVCGDRMNWVPELTSCPVINLNARHSLHARSTAVVFWHRKLPTPGPAWRSSSADHIPADGFVSDEGRYGRPRTSRAFRDEPPARMGGDVAPLDSANAETINLWKARFWTGMAASKGQSVGIQEICRV
jgi:hypothetical protein